MDKNDAQYQLILWRENELDELKSLIIPFVLFGCASAPYLATRVLNQSADDEKTWFSRAIEVITGDCYVDDVIIGAERIKDAKELRDELNGITKSGGFTLRKWVSNQAKIIESMSEGESSINLWKRYGFNTIT